MKDHPIAVQGDMPRPHADTVQVTFRIPSDWIREADALASTMSLHGVPATRTDAFREAMRRGFRGIEEDAKQNSRFRVSAYDGRNSTCLFWFGATKDAAYAEAKRLAKEYANSKWTVFRVFDSEKRGRPGEIERPIHHEFTKPSSEKKRAK